MRLGDLDALYRKVKTECNPYGKPTIDFESGKKVLKIIENAPTVKPRIEYGTDGQPYILSITNGIEERPQEVYMNGKDYNLYLEGYKQGKKDFERPQGEWVGNAFDEHHCNRCGHPALWEEEPDNYYEVQSNFCPNCGAEMRKEDNT